MTCQPSVDIGDKPQGWAGYTLGGIDVHTRWDALIFFLVILPVLFPGMAIGGLLYAPPKQVAPYIIDDVSPYGEERLPRKKDPHVFPGGEGRCFPPDMDVTIYLPKDRPRRKPLSVCGGRNVRIVGGKIDAISADMNVQLQILAATQSVFVEGVHIDVNGLETDAMHIRNSKLANPDTWDLYIQNVYVEGIDGTEEGVHGDILQTQGHVDEIFIEKMSASTGYNGFILHRSSPDSRWGYQGVNTIHFKDFDGRYDDDPTPGPLIFIDNGTKAYFDNVWVECLLGRGWYPERCHHWVTLPRLGQGTEVDEDWTYARMVGIQPEPPEGIIYLGLPPERFVDPNEIGLNYLSPHDRR